MRRSASSKRSSVLVGVIESFADASFESAEAFVHVLEPIVDPMIQVVEAIVGPALSHGLHLAIVADKMSHNRGGNCKFFATSRSGYSRLIITCLISV